jgi:hypothetical protein
MKFRFSFSIILESEHNQLQTNEGSKIATDNYLDRVLLALAGVESNARELD